MRRAVRRFADIFILAFGSKAARDAVFERDARERREAWMRQYMVR